ncbi:hypothetical protein KW786_00505 [Candidatus Parcubacteria bacterium]|nr:hypothetical protein [Candidatus Parcubacteria bacterium]
MKEEKKDYKYLLRLYSLVNEYLAGSKENYDNLPEIIISFCIVAEKAFKLKLYKKNPILVFDVSKFRDNDALIAIVNNKELNIETIKIAEIISRYKLLFDKEFSDDELQVLINIYEKRNHLIHGYKSDEDIFLDKENIVKMMGTVWEKISNIIIALFNKQAIGTDKPKKAIKKYSEGELEKVLFEEVKKKIEKVNYDSPFAGLAIRSMDFSMTALPMENMGDAYRTSFGGELCPRCDSFGFSKDNPDTFFSGVVTLYNRRSGLYKCSKCHLELTDKEYEIAKKIKNTF